MEFQVAQERQWAVDLHRTRQNFIDRVREAMQTQSPTKRRALYAQWRGLHGDDNAREWATYAESLYAGGSDSLLKAFMKMNKDKYENNS